MLSVFTENPTQEQLLWFSAVLAGFIVLGWLAKIFFEKSVHRLTRRTRTYLDDAIISAINKPLIIAVVILGLYWASLFLPLAGTVMAVLNRAISTAFGLLATYVSAALIEKLIEWYRLEVAGKLESRLGHQLVYLSKFGVIAGAVMVAVILVLDFFGMPVTPVKDWLAVHGGRFVLIAALAIIAVFVLDQAIPRVVSRSVSRGAGELEEEVKKRADTLSKVLAAAGQAFVLFVAVFILLSELGIDIAPVLAGVGVVGLAVGFGAQNLVRDILAGLFVILENQYRVGDVVRVADISGLVEDINLRRTVLRDLDGIVHFVPNGEIKVASNFTREWSRVNLNVSVGYGEDLDRVIAVINRVGKELAEDPAWAPSILKTPQVLRVDNLGDSGIDIKILGDTRPIKQWDVMGELRKRIKKAFDQEGIEIPWPHTKVYFGNSPFKSSPKDPG
ncbi:MAG: mechanosensitive ion channel family protein [Chloroflexi bacterium]|nr:mechanosensitive ion channel family protein [Chloroflexota bacterium]